MKQQIIELLAFPRTLVRDHLELETCPHNGFFDQGDMRCLQCENGMECEWLYSNDEFAALQKHSLKRLTDALEFAVFYVEAEIARWGHDTLSCSCDSCKWLRRAQQMVEEVQAA